MELEPYRILNRGIDHIESYCTKELPGYTSCSFGQGRTAQEAYTHALMFIDDEEMVALLPTSYFEEDELEINPEELNSDWYVFVEIHF